MHLYVGVTNKNYDLDIPQERFRLRGDLDDKGFFLVAGNKKYWSIFDRPRVSQTEVRELIAAFKWFEVTVQKAPMTRN